MKGSTVKNARLLLFLSLLLVASCGDDDQAELTPLSGPETETISAIAGSVRDTEGALLGDVVVTLEAIVNGRAASIDALINGQVEKVDPVTSEKGDDAGATPAPAPAAAALRSTVTDVNGHFVFDQVALGSYLIEARGKDHLAASLIVARAMGDTTIVDIDLIPTGTITGIADRVGDPNDRGNIVYVAGTSYSAISAADGSYAMTGVPIGTIQVFAQYPGYFGDESGGTLTVAGESIQIPPLYLEPRTNIQPNASFTVVESPPYYQNQIIRFVPSAVDLDGIVVSYEFQFDPFDSNDPFFDTFTSTPDTVQTSYASEGERVVKLRARDDSGDYGLYAERITIEPNQPPTATLSGPSPVTQGDLATFNAAILDPENDIALVEWDTAGGGTFDISTGVVPSLDVLATTLGQHSLTVRVTDGGGLQGTDTFLYEVESAALYVSTSGSPGGAGTAADPLSSIQAALDLAQSEGRPSVIVATGTYQESIALRAGVDLLGGRDELGGWVTTAQRSIVVAQGVVRHSVFNVHEATLTESMEFRASTTTTASSYGMLISSASQLVFQDCRFLARDAVDGTPGNAGANGVNANPGTSGGQGSCDGSHGNGGSGGFSPAGCNGGTGGRGGLEDGPYSGLSGATGSCGGGSSGGGGAGGDPGSAGSTGTAGANGVSGSGGTSAPNTSSLTGISIWGARTSGSGISGSHGRGGGGGGGGGAQHGTFVNNGGGNGGGGGGGGGQAGTGGTGGTGGEGSFAVFMIFASAQFNDCEFVSGDGGRGGNGGPGGGGGVGGLGGFGGSTCTGEIGRGGDGGAGGDGGWGGGGAGGPGGPSLGIYSEGSSPTVSNGTFILGALGPGGTGGAGAFSGQNGTAGLRQNIYTTP